MPKSSHEVSDDTILDIASQSREQLLQSVAIQIDPTHPDFLSEYRRVEGLSTDRVELYVAPQADSDKLKRYAEILAREINNVHSFFGINPGLIPPTTLVIGTFDEVPDGYETACALQIKNGDQLQPVVYSPDYRIEFGGEESTPAFLRHEYLHSIDHILGDGHSTFSNLTSYQIGKKILEIFPDLADRYYDDDTADYLNDVLEHMRYRHILPASDDLIDIVGETRVLVGRPFVGHPKDSEEEFVVSLLNVICDKQFEESVASKTDKEKANIGQLYPFVKHLILERISELRMAA